MIINQFLVYAGIHVNLLPAAAFNSAYLFFAVAASKLAFLMFAEFLL